MWQAYRLLLAVLARLALISALAALIVYCSKFLFGALR